MSKRRSIAQVKDPTKPIWWPLIAVVALLLWKIPTIHAEDLHQIISQNVTCIYHDSKYTCDCNGRDELMQLPLLQGGVNQLQVTNCKNLTIHGNALNELEGLRKIAFDNVDHLVLQKYALAYSRYASGTPIVIEFKKVVFDSIDSHAFNGNIEEISFLGGRIGNIHPFAFTTLKERASIIKMDSVWFGRIDAQAFKRFTIDRLEIKNCVFELNVPSKAFYELEILDTLLIHNVRFHEIFTKAFLFKTAAKVSITNNYFDKAHAAWIEVQVFESVVFRDNSFGNVDIISFNAITLSRNYVGSVPLELHFINNKVRFENEPLPLQFNSRFMLDLKHLEYDNNYACSYLNNENPPRPKHDFFQRHADQIYFRRGTATTNTTTSTTTKTSQSSTALAKLIESDCRPRSYLLYIILGVFGIILVLALIAVLLYCKWSRNKRRKMDIVLPEPRTYKETQIIYQIENAGLLKTDL